MIFLSEDTIRFLNDLNYHINQKNGFYKKIPSFEKQLNKLDFQIGLKESIITLKNNCEKARRRNVYKTLITEFKDLIKKK